MKKKIAVVAGTRPELIKLVPVVKALRTRKAFEVVLCASGQHKELFDSVAVDFDLQIDAHLDTLTPGQSLAQLNGQLFSALDHFISNAQPDAVLVQGDTTTAYTAAMVAFYQQIPVGHIEAGLRSDNIHQPFPEEVNRRIISIITQWHYCPTQQARQHLIAEKVDENRIVVTGNTVIDALFDIRQRYTIDDLPHLDSLAKILEKCSSSVLITGHRRESFGAGFENICDALLVLANRYPNTAFIYPVHMNPNVREVVNAKLSNVSNIHLLAPLGYKEFVWLMAKSSIILTDSGGVQEEGPSLGKPVLVMREVTERMEGVEAGTAKLIGPNRDNIVNQVSALLDDEHLLAAYAQLKNPYGDGTAAIQIADHLEHTLLNQRVR